MYGNSQYLLYSTTLLLTFFVTTTSIIQSPPNIVKEPSVDELLFQVPSDQYENDKPFIIDCEAEGEPAPKYRWIKNGKNFNWQAYDDRIAQQLGSGSLRITRPRDEDLGQYQCFAENVWGIATSKSVMVVKAEFNSFNNEPNMYIEAQEGEPFKLICNPPTGWPKPIVYWVIWEKNRWLTTAENLRMTTDPEGNLWFSNVTRNDARFTYYCYAESWIMSKYKLSKSVKINVIQNAETYVKNKYPLIQQYVSRRNEVALLNKKVELFCIYGGTPLPQTIWLKDGIAIKFNKRVTLGNYGKSLIIWKINFEDGGNYTCEVSNGVGLPESYNILLDVMAAPIFTVIPQIVEGGEGETAVIKCEASGNPQPSIKWIHNGRPLSEASPNPKRFVTSNSITITSLTKYDIGNYGCNATNSIGYVYKDVYINVLALAPQIIEFPLDVKTFDGSTTVITCKPYGVPKPHIKWIRNGIELTGGRYSILDSGDLEISKVSFIDAGIYTCIGTNNYGMASASGTLTVTEITEIITEPEDNMVVVGSMAIFNCIATADHSLHLNIDWLVNGEPINYDTQPRFIKINNYSLIITKTIELDSGIYTCLANTELDQVTANATLIVQDKPNPPTLLKITCNKINAVLKWQPNGDNRAPILRYIIEYNTSFEPGTWLIASNDVPASNLKFIAPMTPWANFTFRVIAKNKIGKSNPSLHSSVCSTHAQLDVPYKNPENIEIYGTDSTNLVVNWTPMPKIAHNAPGLRYRVYWKQDIPDNVWNLNETIDYTINELVFPNQPTYTRYKVKVVAFNEKGESSGLQNEVIGYSGEDGPLDAPKNLTVLNITGSKSAILSWEPVSPESVRGNFKGYKIQFWADRDGEDNKIEEEVSLNKTTVEIKKFFPNANNTVCILAYNSRFNGPLSPNIYFVTPEGVPGPVNGVEAKQWGSSAILLSWQPPDEVNGVLTGYEVSYESMTERGAGERTQCPSITNPKQTTVKLTSLKPSTNYRIYIKATTKVGVGEPFFIEQQTKSPLLIDTELNKPVFNYVHKAYNKIFDTVRIFWTPNLDGNPGSHFFVKYKLKSDYLYEETKHEFYKNFIDVKGLKPEKLYEFIVVTVDGDIIRQSDTVEIEAVNHVVGIIEPEETTE